jgi:hypothetical protein
VEKGDEPLSPIIDGERFAGLDRLVVNVGPRVRIARPARPRSGGHEATHPDVEYDLDARP